MAENKRDVWKGTPFDGIDVEKYPKEHDLLKSLSTGGPYEYLGHKYMEDFLTVPKMPPGEANSIGAKLEGLSADELAELKKILSEEDDKGEYTMSNINDKLLEDTISQKSNNITDKKKNYGKDGEEEGQSVPTDNVKIEDDENATVQGEEEYDGVKDSINTESTSETPGSKPADKVPNPVNPASKGPSGDLKIDTTDDEDAILQGDDEYDDIEDSINMENFMFLFEEDDEDNDDDEDDEGEDKDEDDEGEDKDEDDDEDEDKDKDKEKDDIKEAYIAKLESLLAELKGLNEEEHEDKEEDEEGDHEEPDGDEDEDGDEPSEDEKKEVKEAYNSLEEAFSLFEEKQSRAKRYAKKGAIIGGGLAAGAGAVNTGLSAIYSKELVKAARQTTEILKKDSPRISKFYAKVGKNRKTFITYVAVANIIGIGYSALVYSGVGALIGKLIDAMKKNDKEEFNRVKSEIKSRVAKSKNK